jgi:hypothetical protein
MRVLISGVRLRSTQPGGVHSGSPSGLMWQVQPSAQACWPSDHSQAKLAPALNPSAGANSRSGLPSSGQLRRSRVGLRCDQS